jgi:hypothetical protein
MSTNERSKKKKKKKRNIRKKRGTNVKHASNKLRKEEI